MLFGHLVHVLVDFRAAEHAIARVVFAAGIRVFGTGGGGQRGIRVRELALAHGRVFVSVHEDDAAVFFDELADLSPGGRR
jgi:hypothetical protein